MKPLTTMEHDLKDFPYMPLDVARLRDSDLAALETPEACWAAVLLWCASWHQIPAASLPNDDRVLAKLAGFGRVVKEWEKVKDGALRGWLLCDDGRLYHPVIADKAISAFNSKLERVWKTEVQRIKKHNERHPEDIQPVVDFNTWLSQRQNNIVVTTNENVSQMSVETLPLTERERERDTETEQVVVKSGEDLTIDTPPAKTTIPGLVCKALRESGIPDGNPTHPDLIALCAAGATVEEFTHAAIEAKEKNKGRFKYIVATVKNRREDAAKLNLHQGVIPNRQESLEIANGIATDQWKPPELRNEEKEIENAN